MKKLALVTLLAVAASWLLHEARQSDDAKPEVVEAIDQFRGRHGDRGPHRVTVAFQDEAPIAPPMAPVPPVPPSPPESIRTVPWKGDRSRRDRSAPAKPPGVAMTPSVRVRPEAPPSWFPKLDIEEQSRTKDDAFGSRVLLGRLSASPDRARQDLRQFVERDVADWIAADIPHSWKVPSGVIDSMSQGSYVQEVIKRLTPALPEAEGPSTAEIPGGDGLYTLYRAGQKLDFSPSRKAQIVRMYRKDLASRRMYRLGGGLAVALVGLAVLSGYIKADEATKGYYTNRLRLLAAAGLGASGVVAYRFLS